MKRFTKIMAILMVTALIMSIAAISGSAYTAVNGDNSLSFNKFLIVDSDARIPAITFNYTIAPGSAVAADSANNKPAIIAGVGTPTIGSASFASGETAYDTKQGSDEVTLDSGEKYAKKTVTVDFSSVQFSQPGIYRYVITESTNADNKAVSYDTQTNGTARTRYLDVYVEDENGSGTLKVSSYVMHETTDVVAADTSPAPDKSSGFVNEITSHEFTFGKEVTGNQGSKDKYFKFTLTINGAQANTTYAVDLSAAEANPTQTAATVYDSMTNPTTITTGSHGVVTEYFYLKDGQYITIKGLPEGYMYELSELKEDYVSTNGISQTTNGTTAYQDPVVNTTTGVTADIKTGFTNDRTGVIPTGVLLTIAPFAVGIFLFGALIIFFIAKRRRTYY